MHTGVSDVCPSMLQEALICGGNIVGEDCQGWERRQTRESEADAHRLVRNLLLILEDRTADRQSQ